MKNSICSHFEKDYSQAIRTAYAVGEASGFYWEWTCAECGQIYREKCKELINTANEKE